jgi:3-oxoacyl-[acyl-carrier-protein] synthase II
VKPIAITGAGITSALGIGALSRNGDALRDGGALAGLASAPSTAPSAVASFDASRYDSPPIVEVPDFDPKRYLGDKGLRTLDRLTKLLVVTARLCLHDAGLKRDGEWIGGTAERTGVCCSNAYGSIEAISELDRVLVLEDARYINPAKFPNTVSNSASGYVSIWEDLRALNVTVSDGNCGGLDAIAVVDLILTSGRADAILTGGGEAMSEGLFLAFERLGVLEKHSARASGARLGEGAAFFALEYPERALARGAKIRALVTGYGTAFVAPKDDVTLLHAAPEALERAIAQALSDAGVKANEVDLVVSGIAGIGQFDTVERAAIAAVLGNEIAIAAPKQWFGETLGAGAALGIAAGLAWLDGTPPRLLAGALPAKIDTVVVTSLGYYGNASAVVLRRPSLS